MNVSKFDLEEFNLAKKSHLANIKLNINKVKEQDNSLIRPDFESEINDVDRRNDNNEIKITKEAIASEDQIKETFELEKQILEQNQILQATLGEVKDLLVDIEKHHNNHFLELSQSLLMFIKSLINKILVNDNFSKIVVESMSKHINEILGKVKKNSSLNVKIPSNLSENIKTSLLETFKSTASKFNIDVIEHEDRKIAIEWQDGKAELEIDAPIKMIEDEMSKLDTIG